jgi:hypothetical protein
MKTAYRRRRQMRNAENKCENEKRGVSAVNKRKWRKSVKINMAKSNNIEE